MFESEKDTTLKMMIVLSDGVSTDIGRHDNIVVSANNNDVKVYTVGLGNSSTYFTDYLEPLAINTGGEFYFASDANALAEVFDSISERIDIETDSDGDGLPDYYEDNMLCFNGVKLELDKNDPDTDNDGLKDGEEIELKYEYNASRTQVKVTGKITKGNPVMKDTDGDGFADGEDVHVYQWDVSDRDLAMCASMSYSYIPLVTSLKLLSPTLTSEINNRFSGVATLEELGSWSVVGTLYADAGLQAIAFKIDSNIIVAYRGSDEFVDWFNNATTYILGLSTHTGGAQNFIEEIMDVYSGYNIYVTGHSLGGHLAYNAGAQAIYLDASAVKGIVTFNGLGLVLGVTLVGDL